MNNQQSDTEICAQLNEQLRLVRLEFARLQTKSEEQEDELIKLRNDLRRMTAERDTWRLKAHAYQHGTT